MLNFFFCLTWLDKRVATQLWSILLLCLWGCLQKWLARRRRLSSEETSWPSRQVDGCVGTWIWWEVGSVKLRSLFMEDIHFWRGEIWAPGSLVWLSGDLYHHLPAAHSPVVSTCSDTFNSPGSFAFFSCRLKMVGLPPSPQSLEEVPGPGAACRRLHRRQFSSLPWILEDQAA